MPSSDPSAWVVHKFGGSSVADAECFQARRQHPRNAAARVAWAWCSRPVAASPTRCSVSSRAPKRRTTPGAANSMRCARVTHTIAEALLKRRRRASSTWRRSIATGTTSKASCTPSSSRARRRNNVRDLIAGYGEIWSTKLFREFFDSRAQASGRRALGRRAPGRGGRVGSAGSRRAMGRIARQARRAGRSATSRAR